MNSNIQNQIVNFIQTKSYKQIKHLTLKIKQYFSIIFAYRLVDVTKDCFKSYFDIKTTNRKRLKTYYILAQVMSRNAGKGMHTSVQSESIDQ